MATKLKMKQIQKVVGDVDINGLFEEMMGVKDAEKDIIVPKFVLIRNTLRYIYRVLCQFATFSSLRNDFPDIIQPLDEIKQFSEEMKESAYLKHDHDEKADAYSTVDQPTINNLYRKLKENPYLKKLIVMCNQLDKFQKNFSDPNNLRENFVNQEPGLSFFIFEFSSLDLKKLWADDKMKSSVKKYILNVLAALYKHSYALFRIVTSPDVDIEKFTQVLLASIGELKKQPKLSRCKGAFGRIEQSVTLLKDKFEDYYRETVASKNPDTLVTSFIVDVSNQGGANASLTREFRTIIQYMHEMSEKTGKNKDPKVKQIFDMLNNNFNMMDKHSKKAPDAEAKTLDSLDLTSKTEETQSAAEEKEIKRLEKLKAKKKRKAKTKNKKPTTETVEEAEPSVDVSQPEQTEQAEQAEQVEQHQEFVEEQTFTLSTTLEELLLQ